MNLKLKRFLVIRIDRIGDVVLSTPIPREVKSKYPDAFVAVLCRDYTKDVYIHNPNVDLIISLEELKEKGFWGTVFFLRKLKFDASLLLLPDEWINYVLFFSGVKCRVGTGYKFYQFITGVKGISRKKYIPLRHEADYCMDQARYLGIQTDNLTTEIFLTDEEKEKSSDLRKELLDGKKYLIGLHISSGGSAPNWEPEKYLKLSEKLEEQNDVKVVFTDNVVPKNFPKEKQNIFINFGKTLRETIISINSLDCLVSASTGPMHIAAALKVKTISLFCPLPACSPKLWRPLGNESIELLPSENYCQTKCPGDPKICTFDGEGGIEIKQVVEAVNAILKVYNGNRLHN